MTYVRMCLAASMMLTAAIGSSVGQPYPEAEASNPPSKAVTQALSFIEAQGPQNIDRLIEITEMAAPPFKEEKRAALVAEKIRALGLDDVMLDEAGNLIARRPGRDGARRVAIIAHLDTVFPAWTDVTVKKDGDTYTAPGIGDNSRGIVVMLALIEALEQANIQTRDDLIFVGSVGEEGLGDLRGVRHLFREGAEPIDAVIAIDGGALTRVVNGAVGSNRYRVTFSGPGGHSYGAFGRAHPHQALAKAITLFTERATPMTMSGPKATFSVGRIGGGTSINSIPFSSWMEVDMRSVNADALAELDAIFRLAIRDALAAENNQRRLGDELAVEIKPVGARPAGSTPADDPLVVAALGALGQLGVEASLADSSTDANIPMSLGIPAVTLSRGGISRNAHAPNESWTDLDSHLAIQAALLTILAAAGQVDAEAE